jgi:hypothetical protein
MRHARVRMACNCLRHDASTSFVALDPQLLNIVPSKLSEHDDDELSPNLKNLRKHILAMQSEQPRSRADADTTR